MKITKYICDKCGKEIKIKQIYKTTVQEGLAEGISGGIYESFHLCEDCVKKFLKWLKEHGTKQ